MPHLLRRNLIIRAPDIMTGPVLPIAAVAPITLARLLGVAGCYLILLGDIVPTVSAQQRFDSWTTENGLPQNSVNDILQTRDGYLWLATHGGLVRFDGVRFVVFDRSIEGIGSQRVRALHEDRHGTLWAATEDGMMIRYVDGQFITYGSADGLPHAVGVTIEEDDVGSLWITWVGHMTRFDGQRFVTFASGDFPRGVAAPPLERYTDVWWRQDSSGLHALIKGRVWTYPVAKGSAANDVTRVLSDRCGNLWINTRAAGLIKAAAGRIDRYSVGNELPGNRLQGVLRGDCDRDIWLSGPGATLDRIRNGRRERIDLPGVRVVYVDREGSTWFGTVAAGLHRLDEPTITVLTQRQGRSLDNIAYSILEDRTGAVWIGNGGLKRYAAGRFTPFSAQGVSADAISSIYEDKAGRLWVGRQSGLTYLHNGRLTPFDDTPAFLQKSVPAIVEDLAGAFWFATDAGLVKWSGGEFTRYTTEDGLSHDRITALFSDRSGALWIGTFHGLTRLKDGVFTVYTERHGLIGTHVRAFHEDRDGVLWIGTYDGGLYRLANERLTRYTRNDGLHDNGVFQILEDGDGYFWMGSNRGISRVSRRELNEFAEGRRRSVASLVFDARDGLASVEVNGGRQPAGWKTRDGKLWFPTMGGVAVIDPAAFRTTSTPPRAIIEELRLGGDRIDVNGEVSIPPDAPALEIRYTAPSFIKPEQLKFRYRLVGLDDEWTDAGDRRTASFYRLPPGQYRFDVIAASHDGVWAAEGPQLALVVLPPFWRTWWFIALALAAVASAAMAAHGQRVRRLRRLHNVQGAFSRQLIESEEGERRRIANEMHDSLGQHVAIIRKRARTGREFISDRRVALELDEIATLADQIDAEIKEIAQGLRPYQLDTIGLAKAVETMVRRVGSASHIEFTLTMAPIDDVVPERFRIHVFRIVQECVSNIVRHSDASRAAVSIARIAASIEIKVEDSGKGFSPEILDAGGSTSDGFGLAGIRERARILGGRVSIRSSARTGTVVIVTFPLGSAAHE